MEIQENAKGRHAKIIVNLIVLGMAFHGSLRQEIKLSESSKFDQLMINSISSIQSGITYVKRDIAAFWDHYVINVGASKENRILREQILDLQDTIFQYEEVARENSRLKTLLQFSEALPRSKVLARVVAWDASSDYQTLRIDKGASEGIKLQSVVISSKGLVGYVYRLTNHFADVLTILDSNNRVDAIVERVRTHGIVEGRSNGKCLMKYVTRTAPIILNDQVFTSGMGNIYPKGLKIGSVSKIERESFGITQYIEVTPSIDIGSIEEVVVLILTNDDKKKQEWAALDNPAQDEAK